MNGSLVEPAATMFTDVGDVRVKPSAPGPIMASVVITVPENLSGAPVLKLTETGELGHGGVGPLSAAEMVAPGLTLDPNAGVQTDVAACAGAVIKGATQAPIVAMRKVAD